MVGASIASSSSSSSRGQPADWLLVVSIDEPTGGTPPCWFEPRPADAPPPRAVVLEASRDGAAAVEVLAKLRAEPSLRGVPRVLAGPLEVVERLGDAGFDDFVVTPIRLGELLTRLRRAQHRRGGELDETVGAPPSGGDLVVDLAAHRVLRRGRVVPLTRREFGLLAFFSGRRGRVFTREELLYGVWGTRDIGRRRTVDIHVRRLRAKLGTDAFPLETIRGVGYRLPPADEGRSFHEPTLVAV